jgi:hypothetical protein
MWIRIRDPESFGPWIWDPGWKKFGSGIRDKHPGSATLLKRIVKISNTYFHRSTHCQYDQQKLKSISAHIESTFLILLAFKKIICLMTGTHSL